MATGRKMTPRFSCRKTLLPIVLIALSYGCIDQNRSLAADVKINKKPCGFKHFNVVK
jgi:hypothetical protein